MFRAPFKLFLPLFVIMIFEQILFTKQFHFSNPFIAVNTIHVTKKQRKLLEKK